MAKWSQDQQSASLNTHVCLESRHSWGGDTGTFPAQVALIVLRATPRKWTLIPSVCAELARLWVECGSEQLCPFDLKYGKATAREVVRVSDWNTLQDTNPHNDKDRGSALCAWQRVPLTGLSETFLSRAGEIDDAVAPRAPTRPGYSPVFTFLVLFSSRRFGVKRRSRLRDGCESLPQLTG